MTRASTVADGAASAFCELDDAVLESVLDYVEVGWGKEERTERLHRRTAAAVSLLSKRFVDVGQRAMLRRVVVHWPMRPSDDWPEDDEPLLVDTKRIERLADTLRLCGDDVPTIRRLVLAFWTEDDEVEWVDMHGEKVRDMPCRQLTSLLELLAGRVHRLELDITPRRLEALMMHHGESMVGLGAQRMTFELYHGCGPASDVVESAKCALRHFGSHLVALRFVTDVTEGGEGHRPVRGSGMPVALDDAIALPRLRTLSYSAGVDNLLPALLRAAPGVDALGIEDSFDLIGATRLDEATRSRIKQLCYSSQSMAWESMLDLGEFQSLASFEARNNTSIHFCGRACDTLQRISFHPEGLIEENWGQDPAFYDSALLDLVAAIEDPHQWPSLSLVSVSAPRQPRPATAYDYDERWMRAVGEAVETVRMACESRGVNFALI